jgi:hypothetical protein
MRRRRHGIDNKSIEQLNAKEAEIRYALARAKQAVKKPLVDTDPNFGAVPYNELD